jgi:mRNA-degrading endonuclease RelE of RelBE toxin-antitoxin system
LAALQDSARANPEGRDAALLRSVVRYLVEVIADPVHAFDPRHALRAPLASVRRIKAGRLRIFYLASKPKRRAIVLAVGNRKEGDKRDAYKDFERRIRRGEFDAQFAELGIQKPKV